MATFRPVSSSVHFPELEEEVLASWQAGDTFRRSVEGRPEDQRYIFYDGPPFATGLPHYGHLVASTLKDIVPRYWAMRGYRVERRFGWDTHGLPIEMEVEKQLGLNGPSEIRAYGVAEFNEACRSGVLRYTAEWEKVVGRLGRWVDFSNDYKTMDASFMESVWWVFRELWDRGLVYEDFRVMPFSWRLSTSLSNFEANMDYREVQDPALTVSMPLVDGSATLLIWTTTPWTLPSNLAVAVGPDLRYVKARRAGDETVYIVAEARLQAVLGKEAEVVERFAGSELVGRKYTPLFDYFADKAEAFVVIAAPHVTTSDGTGLVHMAPDFGEEDFKACRQVGIGVLRTVDDEGRFSSEIKGFEGRNVKEADHDLIKLLKEKGRVLKHETIQHSYPFCWRSDTPLIYKAVPARFVKVEALRDRMQTHNQGIHWVPEAVGQKRFGNWLAEARDWNVSRKRFWGTPLPIWKCEACAQERCIGSIAELEAASGATVTDLHPHKIDHLVMACAACGGVSRRIADVFDCWFESGAMPYAQRHHPFEGAEHFAEDFPAQFIAEGLDQTRGWFYTLLVLSTALYDKAPFKNCVVNGMVLAEDGSKMSKRKQNYPAPDRIFHEYGADALRAYLINSPIVRAEPLRFSERGVKEVVRTVLIPLRNAWSFFVQYANIDGWHPERAEDISRKDAKTQRNAEENQAGWTTPAVAERPELDRWVLSVLQSLVGEVNTQMEGYYLYKVVPPVLGFIDDLTNWYIRRSRRRFWRSAEDAAGRADKAAAYATLYEVLVTFSKVLAPVLPFVSDALYRSLVVEPGCAGPDSVHLCDYPVVRKELIDQALESQVALARQVVSLGRALREQHRLKTRQPLRRVLVVHHDAPARAALETHADIIADELNVKVVNVVADDGELATLSFKADFKRLGKRFGPRMKEAAAAIGALTATQWHVLADGGSIEVADASITAEDVLVTRTPRGDVVILTEGAVTVALDTELDAALITEGLVREVQSRLQRLRKDSGLEITDRIDLSLGCADEELRAALEAHRAAIAEEVLAESIEISSTSEGEVLDIDGRALSVRLQKRA